MAFPPAPLPSTPLGYHRILSPKAGVRVSPLCLGAMNFGEAWEPFMGKCKKDTAFELLDCFFEHGGNFIDTANNYQEEESETWIGEWMAARGNRDQVVIATKYTTCYPKAGGPEMIKINFQGNHAKSLRLSVEASLKKLQTDYIDLLYVHWWDFSTSIEEVMQALHRLVLDGKVLYLGVSDTPAWVVSSANRYARDHGLSEFVVYQGRWSAADRDFERDILPMALAEGMALAPFGALGGGAFKTAASLDAEAAAAAADPDARKGFPPSAAQRAVAAALQKIAATKGPDVPVTSVALAYVLHKAPYVFPVVGGRRVDHLRANIVALSLELSQDEVDEIEDAAPFDIGFPANMIFLFFGQGKYRSRMNTGDINLVKSAGHLDMVPERQPIKPRKV